LFWAVPMPEKPALTPGEILIAEYHYISQAIFQTNEDRSRVASFYMITFGSFIAAVVTYRLNFVSEQLVWVQWGFAGLFLALALIGLLTVLQLARLRLAWLEGLDAMNRIKDYYIAGSKGLEKAFAWRADSTPARFKPSSVGFMLVIQVAVLAGAALGTAVFFSLQALSGSEWLLPSFLAGCAYCLLQLDVYRNMLK
jgi:hypothetical protein